MVDAKLENEYNEDMPKWQTGQSGNVAGRPNKECCFTDALNGRLPPPKLTALADQVIRLALNGNQQTIKLIFDRIGGLPVHTIETNTSMLIDAPVAILDKPGNSSEDRPE